MKMNCPRARCSDLPHALILLPLIAVSFWGQETARESFDKLQTFELELNSVPVGHESAPEIQALFSRYRDQLLEIALPVLQEKTARAQWRQSVEARLRAAGLSAALRKRDVEDPRVFGKIAAIQIFRWAEWAAIVFDFDFGREQPSYGALYRLQRWRWLPALSLDAQVGNGDYRDFRSLVSLEKLGGGDEDRALFRQVDKSFASANGTSELRIRHFEFNADRMQVEFERRYYAKEFAYRQEGQGFLLETKYFSTNLSEGCCTIQLHRFALTPEGWRRKDPVSQSATEFAGNWANMPWEDAEQFVADGRLESAKEFWMQMRAGKDHFAAEMERFLCDSEGKEWGVAVEQDRPTYLAIRKLGSGSFRVVGERDEVRAGCKRMDNLEPDERWR